MIGLGLTATGHWPYGAQYSGAIVVANFNVAILMRNEVFGRLLYLFVNTFFAKVGIQLLNSSLLSFFYQWPPLWFRLGCTSVLQVSP
jgi:hypothetical protein